MPDVLMSDTINIGGRLTLLAARTSASDDDTAKSIQSAARAGLA
jgi:hypothetical protein